MYGNVEGKTFAVEIGRHVTSEDAWLYEEGTQLPPDGLIWDQHGGFTESFPEAEARGLIASKTYKNVRLISRDLEVINYVEG